jgi:hypothetical protein
MSTPEILMEPAPMRVPSIRSFMRLRQRRRVDLPQPDGPMNAVTSFSLIGKWMPWRALFWP